MFDGPAEHLIDLAPRDIARFSVAAACLLPAAPGAFLSIEYIGLGHASMSVFDEYLLNNVLYFFDGWVLPCKNFVFQYLDHLFGQNLGSRPITPANGYRRPIDGIGDALGVKWDDRTGPFDHVGEFCRHLCLLLNKDPRDCEAKT